MHIGLDRRHKGGGELCPRLRLEAVQQAAQEFNLLDREARFAVDQRQAITSQILQVVAYQPAQLPGVRHLGANLQEQAFP